MRVMTLSKGLAGVLVVLGLLLQGCAAGWLAAGAAAGAGTVAYTEGNLETTYAAPFDRTWNASLAALKGMGIPPTDVERGTAEGSIEAERAGNQDVTIRLEQAGPNATSASIRVGVFGDEQLARSIHRQILAQL